MPAFNLFMLPFAGGSKYSYRAYEEQAPGLLEIIPLDYPGRGAQPGVPLVTDAVALAKELYGQVKLRINDDRPYGIFGHSMGGLMTYLLANTLLKQGSRPPLHLFVTGAAGPSAVSAAAKKRHLLSGAEFLEEIIQLNGCHPDILRDNELLAYFEPILRADFAVAETYLHRQHPPMRIPITVITGTDEALTRDEILAWQEVSEIAVDFHSMEGDHFFIFNNVEAILRLIVKKLLFHLKYS